MIVRKRGRPRKPIENHRQQIGVRVSPSLKTELEEAAALNGRSVAQEAEFRLTQTFQADRAVGGQHTREALNLIGALARNLEYSLTRKWTDDREVATALRGLIDIVMQGAMQPAAAAPLISLQWSAADSDEPEGDMEGLQRPGPGRIRTRRRHDVLQRMRIAIDELEKEA